jgi:hypothetical protein
MYAKTVDLFRSHKAWVGSFRDQVAPETWRIACSAKDILAAIFSMVKKFIMAELISVSWERQLTRVRGMTTCSLDAQRRYWANGMEGGHVVGHDGVRNYWTRHWARIDPHVAPAGFSASVEGAIIVEVHESRRDLYGNALSDKMVGHIFRIEDGLIRRSDIR